MDLDYEKYEEECEKIRTMNETYLELFEEDLADVSSATKKRHLSNVSLFINDYLLYSEAKTFETGVCDIDGFLGDFFIRKCMWSTPGTIKSTACSIKKFYRCMLKHEEILKSDYEYLCEEIKECMPQWQAECEQFNDPDAENPFCLF